MTFMSISVLLPGPVAGLQSVSDTAAVVTPTAFSSDPAAQETATSVGGSFLPGSVWDLIGYAQGFEWPLGFCWGLFC